MIRQLLKTQRKQILIDINTQRDFLLASGNASIMNHTKVLANIRRMMAWARFRNIRIISTCDIYPNNNGGSTASYCIEGTAGQKKIRCTIMNNRTSLVADRNTDLPVNLLWQHKQIILHKRCTNPFDEPRIDRVLSEVKADEFILVGTTAEGAVGATAIGLLLRGKKVSVVVDAVGWHRKREAKLAFRKMEAKGARLTKTKELAGISRLRGISICDCSSCQPRTRIRTLKITV
jgi:nicotinamidase-related amidase